MKNCNLHRNFVFLVSMVLISGCQKRNDSPDLIVSKFIQVVNEWHNS